MTTPGWYARGAQGNPGPQGEPGGKSYVTTVGNGASTSFTINHNLGTDRVVLALRDAATGEKVEADEVHPPGNLNSMQLVFGDPPANNAIRVIVVGAGAPGNQGDQGDQGDPGPPGPPGPSAYEVAVDDGFVGTESQWLSSLVGPQGEGLEITDTVATVGDLPSAAAHADELWATEDGHHLISNGTAWFDANIRGPQGEPGGKSYTEIIGDGTETTFTITHSLGTVEVWASVRDTATGERVDCDEFYPPDDPDTVVLEFASPPAADSLVVVVLGAGVETQGIQGEPGGKSYSEVIGNGSSTSFTITHNLGTTDVWATVRDTTTGERIDCDEFYPPDDENTVVLEFASPPAEDSLRVVVLGAGMETQGEPGPPGTTDYEDLTNIPAALAEIAGLSPVNDNLIQRKAGVWTVRTPSQVKTDLAISTSDVSGLTAAITTAVNDVIDGAPGALDTLNELAAALGDDPNFATTVTNAIAAKVTANAAITGATKTKVTYDSKGLVTAGADATQDDIGAGTTYKRYSDTEKTKLAGIATGATANDTDANLKNRANHTGTQSADTLTDGTTNKAFLAAERTKLTAIEASADVTDLDNVGAAINGASGKTTPVDADTLPLIDSAASNVMKKVTWANLKATIKSYYDSVSSSLTNKDLTSGTNTFPTFNQNTTGSAATLTTARTINGVSFNGSANIVVNKPRVSSLSNTTSVSVNADDYDMVVDTGITGAITLNNPTGTPAEGQKLWYALTGTASRAISYGTAFEDSTVTRPTTTSSTARLDVGFVYNGATSKWRCVAYC